MVYYLPGKRDPRLREQVENNHWTYLLTFVVHSDDPLNWRCSHFLGKVRRVEFRDEMIQVLRICNLVAWLPSTAGGRVGLAESTGVRLHK